VGVPNDIDNSHTLSIIEQKMSAKDWKDWSRDLEREGKGRQGLMEWMTIKMKSRMRATAPLRTGSNPQRSVNHTLGNVNSKGNTSWYRCWLCQNSSHWPDQSEVRCLKYRWARTTYALDALKEPEENTEWKTVTENDVAQNRKTEYRVDIITVHKSFVWSRYSSPSHVGKHFRQNGMQKKGKIFLDSGTQISRIWSNTAELLGLKGRDTFATVAKVGGQGETIRTKGYRVPVSSVDNHK